MRRCCKTSEVKKIAEMDTEHQEQHSYDLIPLASCQHQLSDPLKITLSEVTETSNDMESQNTLMGTHTIEIHLEPSHLVDTLNDVALSSDNQTNSGLHNSQMLYVLKSITEDENNSDEILENSHERMKSGPTVVVVTTMQNGNSEVRQIQYSSQEEKETEPEAIVELLKEDPHHIVSTECPNSTGQKRERPKRKAALNNKYISDPVKIVVAKTESPQSVKGKPSETNYKEDGVEEEVEETLQENPELIISDTSDDETNDIRRCVVCLRNRKFTEDIFDSSKKLYFHISVLIEHLKIEVKGNGNDSGICPECMNELQRWHIFSRAIADRHDTAKLSGERYVEEPIAYDTLKSRIYKNYKKMSRVKEVFLAATHAHYARRNITDKDWDFFCDHLFHSNSVKSEKSRELERFITSREKMSHMFCLKCQKMIPNGKKGYTKHMETDHQDCPVMYPCDICGITFPEKDMTASTEDYYPHWISHFYFNKCNDCGKRFPTKRALGQHRHAVHKNRQVKCDKCGKILANKMSLDLHLLRHLPENEKKKYLIKCKICKRKIAQWNIKSHTATHNDERPWKCDHCDATFKMKGALVSHRDVVHFNLKNHICTICGEAFKSASSLRGHVRRHEGRKDYKCDVCLKEYYTYSALKGHKIVHQTARNFVCEICGKAFKKKKALEEHVTIHTGVKPHQCPICGREIRVKSNLYKHMKIHKKTPHDSAAGNPRRKNAQSVLENNQEEPKVEVSTGATVPTLLTNNSGSSTSAIFRERPPTVVHMLSSNVNVPLIEIKDTLAENPDNVAITQPTTMPSDMGFLNTHFQGNSTTRVHTLALQHQDLLNVPVPSVQFYNANQYFGTDPVPN